MTLTPEQLEEQAGAAETERLFEAIFAADSQAARLAMLYEHLQDVAGPRRAMAGFCVVLLPRLERALGIE